MGSEVWRGVNQGKERSFFQAEGPAFKQGLGIKEHSIFEKEAAMAAMRKLEREVNPDHAGLCRHVKKSLGPSKSPDLNYAHPLSPVSSVSSCPLLLPPHLLRFVSLDTVLS